KIKAILAKGDVREVKATIPSQVADYILNFMRAEIYTLESQHGAKIIILGKNNLPDSGITLEYLKDDDSLQVAGTRVIEMVEPMNELVEPVKEDMQLQESQAASLPDKETKTPRRKRKPRKRPQSVVDREELLTESHAPTSSVVGPTEDTKLNETENEFAKEAISNSNDVDLSPDLDQDQKMATDSYEPAKSVLLQDEKERPLLKKSKPRGKATLQDFLPFS
ncbi:MAG: hypothetical protein ACP5VS_18115, partial [Desulfomonilaceae bacterium]